MKRLVLALLLSLCPALDLDFARVNRTFSIEWFNPREGGALQQGTVTSVTGPGAVNVGKPPKDEEKDWVVLVRIISSKGG